MISIGTYASKPKKPGFLPNLRAVTKDFGKRTRFLNTFASKTIDDSSIARLDFRGCILLISSICDRLGSLEEAHKAVFHVVFHVAVKQA